MTASAVKRAPGVGDIRLRPRRKDRVWNYDMAMDRTGASEFIAETVRSWRQDGNEFRPHSSLGDLTPRQFVDKYMDSLRSQKAQFLAGPVFGSGADSI